MLAEPGKLGVKNNLKQTFEVENGYRIVEPGNPGSAITETGHETIKPPLKPLKPSRTNNDAGGRTDLHEDDFLTRLPTYWNE